jgi:hypothetical protein
VINADGLGGDDAGDHLRKEAGSVKTATAVLTDIAAFADSDIPSDLTPLQEISIAAGKVCFHCTALLHCAAGADKSQQVRPNLFPHFWFTTLQYPKHVIIIVRLQHTPAQDMPPSIQLT